MVWKPSKTKFIVTFKRANHFHLNKQEYCDITSFFEVSINYTPQKLTPWSHGIHRGDRVCRFFHPAGATSKYMAMNFSHVTSPASATRCSNPVERSSTSKWRCLGNSRENAFWQPWWALEIRVSGSLGTGRWEIKTTTFKKYGPPGKQHISPSGKAGKSSTQTYIGWGYISSQKGICTVLFRCGVWG